MNDYIPAEDVEAPFSVNFVTAAGFDRAQLTVRANDAVQLAARLGELEVNEVLDRIVEYNVAFQKKAETLAPQSSSDSRSSGSSSRSSSASQGASSDRQLHPEGLKCPKCQGAVIYKEIKSKAGKTFKLWVCENQRERNDGHHSEFIN